MSHLPWAIIFILRSIFRLGFTLSRRARGFHLPVSGVLCVCVCVRVCVCVCVCDVCDARGVHLPMNGWECKSREWNVFLCLVHIEWIFTQNSVTLRVMNNFQLVQEWQSLSLLYKRIFRKRALKGYTHKTLRHTNTCTHTHTHTHTHDDGTWINYPQKLIVVWVKRWPKRFAIIRSFQISHIHQMVQPILHLHLK